MNATLKKYIVPLAVVVVLAGAFYAWYRIWSPWKPSPSPTPDPTSVIAVTDFDAFQKNLADRVSQQFHVDPNSVVVAPAAYDLGWLLDPVQTYPADSTDCVPAPTPSALSAAHLFPSYQVATNVASTMTLGSNALQQVASASINASHQASLIYSIDQVQVLLMDLKSIDQMSHSGACGQYVSQHPGTRLISGLVLGKISFKFATSNPASVAANLTKLGGISAQGDPNNSTVTVNDAAQSQILEMVSILEPEGTTVAANTLPAVPASTPHPAIFHHSLPVHVVTAHPGQLPGPQPGTGAAVPPPPPAPPTPTPQAPASAHIYLQQDANGDPAAAAAVVTALHQNWPTANIEGRVERIPARMMPSTPQIRFFNTEDQTLANTCHDRLKASTGIDARVVRVGLPAPEKQLEIWLPKAAAQ